MICGKFQTLLYGLSCQGVNVRAVGLVTGERRRVVRCGGNVSAGERFLPKTFYSEWTNIDLDPKCLAFLPPSQVDKKRSKVWKMKWVLEAERGRRGNNSFRSFPPSSTPGESGGGQRLGDPRVWPGYPMVAPLQRGYNSQRRRHTARQFTELPRPCCKFLVRRP